MNALSRFRKARFSPVKENSYDQRDGPKKVESGEYWQPILRSITVSVAVAGKMQFSSKHMKLCRKECTHQKYCLQARNADSPDMFYQKFCLQHVNPRRRILRKLLVLSIEVYRLLVLSFCHLQQRLFNVTAARFKRINVLRGLKTQR